MPCNADYMNPDEAEANSKLVAQLIVYVLDSGEFEGFYRPEQVEPYRAAATDCYGNRELLDEMTAFLCNVISNMSREQEDRLLYNGRNTSARRLADWWDVHRKADDAREADEMMYLSPAMQFLYDHVELNKANSGFIRKFIKEFLDVMEQDGHDMTYFTALQTAMGICDVVERKNGTS